MKSSDNTEMDRLLRRYARSGGEALRGGLEQNQDALEADNNVHLDADELNAYAEGALPESARSRYFAHLADCDTCRKLVTDLTLAASLADEGKVRAAATDSSPSRSWRDWLATIFSPPVLRYGAPALALFAIIVVALVATRTQRDASFVAQNDKAERNSAQETTATSNSSAPSIATDRVVENHSNSNAAPSIEQQNPTAQTVPAATPAPPKTSPIIGNAPTVPLAEADAPAEPPSNKTNEKSGTFGEAGRRIEEAESVPAAQPPPADSAANVIAGNRDRREDQKKAKAIGKDDDVVTSTPNAAGGAVSTESRPDRQRPSTGGMIASRSVQELPARKPSGSAKSEDESLAAKEGRSSETRSVGGHKFRKQGSAWVDTAYKSSLSTTNVARGSEQYRALVADEPSLRAITQQLGGEVIVVWKSRAYRFY
ncbi:MAG: hypothetical protein QOH63_914 [Acidobacteriota bacterium]|jgi:hypothetical protein|nr:hypothetical protein [Acidobacteriota bacterium]